VRPVPVDRDRLGWWEHPDLDGFDSDNSRTPTHGVNIRKFADSGMEVVRVVMPAPLIREPNHMQHWEPKAPAGDGWFLILVWWPDSAGSENGPAAWFARHGLQQSLFSEAA
jgi:hypothetical protein